MFVNLDVRDFDPSWSPHPQCRFSTFLDWFRRIGIRPRGLRDGFPHFPAVAHISVSVARALSLSSLSLSLSLSLSQLFCVIVLHLNDGCVCVLTFRHRASCIVGQAFHYSPENAFYIFNQQIYFIWYLLGIMHRRWCIIPQTVTHSLVLLKMGKIISRNMLSWLELLISRYCCI